MVKKGQRIDYYPGDPDYDPSIHGCDDQIDQEKIKILKNKGKFPRQMAKSCPQNTKRK